MDPYPPIEDRIDSTAALRAVVGEPSQRVLSKQVAALDDLCRAFIAHAPMVLIASCDAAGNMDISPKGDPPGFVQVLDRTTLAIPDRLGNRRIDTLRNILENPRVGLLFLVPGKQETLRVSGKALIARDGWLRERMAVQGKLPDHAIVVSVQEAMFHCAKCMLRSGLWDSADWPSTGDLPTLAQAMVTHGALSESVEEMQALIERDASTRLY